MTDCFPEPSANNYNTWLMPVNETENITYVEHIATVVLYVFQQIFHSSHPSHYNYFVIATNT